jgi:hypothetical protein
MLKGCAEIKLCNRRTTARFGVKFINTMANRIFKEKVMSQSTTSVYLQSTRRRSRRSMLSLGMGLGLAFAAGCGPAPETVTEPTAGHDAGVPASHDSHEGHDHSGHSHAGVHGGHVVVLDPGHVHAEFVHVEADEILEVYVTEIADEVTSVQVIAETEGQEPKTYDLEAATESLGKGGYQIKDPLLLTSIDMADGKTSKVTLKVTTADGTMTALLMEDDSH